jgi:phosphate uptake regulator
VIYRRKVQIVGGSTYTISLPKEWAKSAGLEHGSEVVIEVMPDLTLRVYPGNRGGSRFELENEIEMGDDMELNFAKLISSYIVGYKKLTVDCSGCPKSRLDEFIRWVTERTIGLEVIEKKEGYAVLRCLADVSTLSMAEALGTLMRLTLKSLDDVGRSISTGDLSSANEVIERDSLIDKLYLYILRQLNQVLLGMVSFTSIGVDNIAETIYWAIIVRFLERIADYVANIARDVRRLGPEKLVPTLRYLELLREKYDEVTKHLLLPKRGDEELITYGKLIGELKNIEAEIEKDPLAAGSTENLLRISAHLRDVLELLIDMHALRDLLARITS